MGCGENMGLAQGWPALAGASPTEKACPILLNQYCMRRLFHIFCCSKSRCEMFIYCINYTFYSQIYTVIV